MTSITATIATLNALAADTTADPEARMKEAMKVVEAYETYARADFAKGYPTRDALAKAVADRGLRQQRANASKDTLLDALVSHHMRAEIPGIKEALEPIEQAASSVQQDRWAVETALKALTDWAKGEDHSVRWGSNGSAAQGAAYTEFLLLVGQWYTAMLEQERTQERALKGLVFQIMQYGVLHSDNNLSHTYQIRVGDLDAHLGRRAGAAYALRVIAPAALGVHEAQMIGIQREWYRD